MSGDLLQPKQPSLLEEAWHSLARRRGRKAESKMEDLHLLGVSWLFHVLLVNILCFFCNICLNPNSTNNSIELNLRLDYILTQLSTHHHHTNSLLLLLTAPASQGRQTVQLYSHHQPCNQTVLQSSNFNVFQIKGFGIFLSHNLKIIVGKNQL